MSDNITQQTLELAKAAYKTPNDDLAKAYTQSASATSGITAYDLEAPAKHLYPVLTPLRNKIPRVSGKGGIQANWKAITEINVNNAGIGISEGNRGMVITTTVQDYTAAYRGLGLEDYVTFEADYAGEGFDDVKALAAMGLLNSVMIGEEKMILGGNNSVALGTTPTPALTDVGTGGTLLANTAYNIYCVALTLDAYLASSVAAGLPTSGNRTLADGTVEAYNGGTAAKSAVAAISTANDGNNTHSIKASVTAVVGAVAYAWFWGTAGNELLGDVTTINSVLIAATATGTQNISAIPAADKSTNGLHFDGLLTMAVKSGYNGYRYAMPTGTPGTGTVLTADGLGGVTEIETALQHFWDLYKLSPDEIHVSSQEAKNISDKVLSGKANASQRFSISVKQENVAGGVIIQSYFNRFGMGNKKSIPIEIHPNMPHGTILFVTYQLPYKLTNVTNVMQVRARREYYQIEWPIRTRKYEYGVYADEVLQHYAPFSLGVITNIANG